MENVKFKISGVGGGGAGAAAKVVICQKSGKSP